jgi:glycosyltransferase involved in cell wall biosynthesis
MRILFVTNNYTPYSGGLISSIDSFSQQLRQQGHDVLIVTLDFLGDQHEDPEHVVRISSRKRFLYKQNHMAIPHKPTQEIIAIAQQYKPDVIHVHHPFLLGVSGLRAARYIGVPCVFTYHTLYEQYAHYVPGPSLLTQPIIEWLVKRFCREVDGIIAPSNYVRDYLYARTILTPIEVIPSPLRTLFLNGKEKKGKWAFVSKYFELLVVTRFVQEKNVPFVFDVFKKLPEYVRLTLVGYGAEYENMKRLAFDELNLPRNRVRFVFKPEQHELVELYANANMFIFPSQTDTQGIVVIEAMSQGLPVIALDGPGQRDIIRNGVNGFLVYTAEHAALMIKVISAHGELYAQLSAGAIKTAAFYTPEYTVGRLLEFYELLVHD